MSQHIFNILFSAIGGNVLLVTTKAVAPWFPGPKKEKWWTDLVLTLCATVLLYIALTIDPAAAQVGGGGGAMDGWVTWLVTNIFIPLVGLGLVWVGIRMIQGHHSFAEVLGTWAVGAVLIAFRTQIMNLIMGAGGG